VSFVTDTLDATIARIEVRSAWGPTITIDRPFGPATTPGAGDAVARAARPEIVAYGSGGGVVFSRAPYGAPGPTKWPFVALLAVVGGAVVAGLVLRRLR